jgi:hypothetical protein
MLSKFMIAFTVFRQNYCVICLFIVQYPYTSTASNFSSGNYLFDINCDRSHLNLQHSKPVGTAADESTKVLSFTFWRWQA